MSSQSKPSGKTAIVYTKDHPIVLEKMTDAHQQFIDAAIAQRDRIGTNNHRIGKKIGAESTVICRTLNKPKENLTLNTMARVAEALDCDIVIDIVPKKVSC